MQEAVDYVKTELMPDFDFDAFNHEYPEGEGENGHMEVTNLVAEPAPEKEPAPAAAPSQEATAGDNLSGEEVDKW
jgi:hypothetical protein